MGCLAVLTALQMGGYCDEFRNSAMYNVVYEATVVYDVCGISACMG